MQPKRYLQRSLFEEDRQTPAIPASQRSTLVRLIECLLTEAVAACEAKVQSDSPETKEAAHEQDHA